MDDTELLEVIDQLVLHGEERVAFDEALREFCDADETRRIDMLEAYRAELRILERLAATRPEDEDLL